jgi:hypothetical protein
LPSPLVFVDESTEDEPAPDRLLGRVGEGVVGLWRPELAAATRVPSVVVGLVLSRIECRWRSPKISIWWLPGPGDECELFGVGVRAGLRAGSSGL